jgi:hypothetical protein
MKDSFEILAIITKDYPDFEGKKDKFRSLTKGFNSDKYFDFLKVLNENTIYSLNSNYEVKYEKEKIITVSKTKTLFNLYSYEKKPNIQVNSIVGKNGSGKSTLSEILYLMLYNLSIDKDLLYDENNNSIKNYKGFLNAYLIIKKGKEIVCIDFEVLDFFEYKHSQKNNSKNISFFKKESNSDGTYKFDFSVIKSVDFNIKELFYMISLNYSMYGLNELKMGKWIKHIFHKNDMYDTPIVIIVHIVFLRQGKMKHLLYQSCDHLFLLLTAII